MVGDHPGHAVVAESAGSFLRRNLKSWVPVRRGPPKFNLRLRLVQPGFQTFQCGSASASEPLMEEWVEAFDQSPPTKCR